MTSPHQLNLIMCFREVEKITQELAGALSPEGNGKIIWLGNLVHPNYSICQVQELIIGDLRSDNPELEATSQIALKTHQKAILRFSLEDKHGKSIWEDVWNASRNTT